jgi:Flavin-binding monooxygenase-like
MVSADGRDLPLYRRMVRPGLPGLYFAGFVDAPGGLLPVVETQCQWIAAAITGQLRLPPPERMWHAIDTPNRAPARGSRTKAHAAFAVTRTPTDGSYTPTSP